MLGQYELKALADSAADVDNRFGTLESVVTVHKFAHVDSRQTLHGIVEVVVEFRVCPGVVEKDCTVRELERVTLSLNHCIF